MTFGSTETLERVLNRLPVPLREPVRQELAGKHVPGLTMDDIQSAVQRVLSRRAEEQQYS